MAGAALQSIGLNARAGKLVEALLADAAACRIGVEIGALGETLIDCGASYPGGVEAGVRLAEICLAGLARVAVVPAHPAAHLPCNVAVRTDQPVLACLASQYAGWSLDEGGNGRTSLVLGSGPARALARREGLFDDIEDLESAGAAVLALESARRPSPALIAEVAESCALRPERLTILFAPTASMAGSVQVAARALECAVQKARLAGFPIARIVHGAGDAPLCPPHPDAATAMGRTNDAIIYGGQVHLFVSGPAAEARDLAESLPSLTSPDYGRSFAAVFRDRGCRFNEMDPSLFSPAQVTVSAVDAGKTFRAGAIREDKLRAFIA